MFHHARLLTQAIALALIVARPSIAQNASLVGTVVADSLGNIVTAAEVSIPALGLRTTTNYLGEFKFGQVAAGKIVLNIRRIGFAPFSDTLTLVAGQAAGREFQLTAQATQLDSVKVTAAERKYISPGLAEFEERRKQGIGHFISEDVLRKGDDRSMLEMITGHVPGLTRFRVGVGSFPIYYVSTSRKCSAGPAILGCKGSSNVCPATLYIDGLMVYSAAPGRAQDVPDLSRLSAREYAGVEYYAGGATIPLKYNATDSGCGVLLLWTRER